jgi:hypothetical protein
LVRRRRADAATLQELRADVFLCSGWRRERARGRAVGRFSCIDGRSWLGRPDVDDGWVAVCGGRRLNLGRLPCSVEEPLGRFFRLTVV